MDKFNHLTTIILTLLTHVNSTEWKQYLSIGSLLFLKKNKSKNYMKLGGHIQLIGHFGGGQHNNLIDFPWFAKKKVRSFETGGVLFLDTV